VPDDIGPLKKSFYQYHEAMDKRWSEWLTKWKSLIGSGRASTSDVHAAPPRFRTREELSRQMKLVNPKYSLREWFLVPAYSQATVGNYALVRELQEVMTHPYAEQAKDVEEKYYRPKPSEFFEVGGLSYVSCSS
jgi:uncharacterized protein YdiU (UPF0061 family)